ncbi:MAG: sigma 54-interacting transcriptional regulator [Myxococcales bacterium]
MNPALALPQRSPAPAAIEAEPVAVNPAMGEVLAAARDVAATPTTVLILGESGSGKSHLARYIHQCSDRVAERLITVDCASAPAALEGDLFAALSGEGGTLVLDSVSELAPHVQARLLRALQERPAHGPRVVATARRDLAARVRAGLFRADLFYRLNVFPLTLPALRERIEDVPALAQALLARTAQELGTATPTLSADAVEALKAERFPGNVRELANLIERTLVRSRAQVLDAAALGLQAPPPPATLASFPTGLPLDLNELERLAIEEALRRVGGNRTHAAKLLGIGLRTLRNKLNRWRAEPEAGQVEELR